MDVTPEQRQAAAASVREAMRTRGWGSPQLAARANIGVETVRDFLACRRWPRTGKRAAMEAALGWDTGRIQALANEAMPEPGDPVRLALDRSPLSDRDRYEVLALYLERLNRSGRGAG